MTLELDCAKQFSYHKKIYTFLEKKSQKGGNKNGMGQ